MNLRLTLSAVLMLGLSLAPAARAEPPPNVQIEVNFLLGYIDGSACEFYRNGTWRDPKAAQEHLRDKYKYLVARNRINSTEDFIELAATVSSYSGQPYKVRCQGGATVTSNQWLYEELARFRMFKEKSGLDSVEPGPDRAGMRYAFNASESAGYVLLTGLNHPS